MGRRPNGSAGSSWVYDRFCHLVEVRDGSSGYTYKPRSAERIHAYNPEMKMVLLLRDPMARAFSDWNVRHWNHFGYESFEEAVNDQIKSIRGRNSEFGGDARPAYLHRGLYALLTCPHALAHVQKLCSRRRIDPLWTEGHSVCRISSIFACLTAVSIQSWMTREWCGSWRIRQAKAVFVLTADTDRSAFTAITRAPFMTCRWATGRCRCAFVSNGFVVCLSPVVAEPSLKQPLVGWSPMPAGPHA